MTTAPAIPRVASRDAAGSEEPLPASSRKGAGQLIFTHSGGRTRLTRAKAHSPLRILSPRNAGTGAWAYTSTFGGGLVGGDEISLELDAGAGALACLSTQSATKVFRSKDSRITRQNLAARVADDALVILIPDPTACFAGARFRQTQRVDLAATGSVALLDWVTSGRHANGERWAASECLCRNEIWRAGRCLFRDAVRLPPMAGAIGMHYFNCFSTLILQGPRLAQGSQNLLETLRHAPLAPARGSAAVTPFGISPLGDGLILRAAGPDAEHVASFLFPLLDFVAEILGDVPWKRKW